jgi:hypothetical protein
VTSKSATQLVSPSAPSLKRQPRLFSVSKHAIFPFAKAQTPSKVSSVLLASISFSTRRYRPRRSTLLRLYNFFRSSLSLLCLSLVAWYFLSVPKSQSQWRKEEA